jgi:hypothetical protein
MASIVDNFITSCVEKIEENEGQKQYAYDTLVKLGQQFDEAKARCNVMNQSLQTFYGNDYTVRIECCYYTVDKTVSQIVFVLQNKNQD